MKTIKVGLTLFLIFTFLCCSSQKAEWQGSIEEVDGVTVVKNPKEPMYGPEVFSWEEELSIGVIDGPEYLMFSGISDIDIDNDGNIYVLDNRESCCRVFSPDGAFLRTIGHPGQGPGELKQPYHQHLCKKNQLWIEDFGNRRFAVFTTEGKFLRNFAYTKGRISQTAIDAEGNILGKIIVMTEEKIPHQNAGLASPYGISRGITSPQFRVIDYIVVEQGGSVNKFDYAGGLNLTLTFVAA